MLIVKINLYSLFFVLLLAPLFAAPLVGLAGDVFGDPPIIIEQSVNPLLFGNLLVELLRPIWQIFMGVAIVMFMVAGGLFLSAQGNPEDIKKAQKAFLWGVVGVIVGLLAFVIHDIVRGIIGL